MATSTVLNSAHSVYLNIDDNNNAIISYPTMNFYYNANFSKSFFNCQNLTFNLNLNARILPFLSRNRKRDRPNFENGIPNIIKVCQSVNHIFFLYKERLVILNKLTSRIIHIKYFLKKLFYQIYKQLQIYFHQQ